MSSLFRHIPSVDRFLQDLEQDQVLTGLPRQMLKDLVGEFLDLCREEIRAGVIKDESALAFATLAARAVAYARTRPGPISGGSSTPRAWSSTPTSADPSWPKRPSWPLPRGAAIIQIWRWIWTPASAGVAIPTSRSCSAG